jgi:hypothetical protein
MKFYITGSTRGLGKYLAEYFNCIQIDKPSYNLTTDAEQICKDININDIVILNAHANQIEYVKLLKDKCRLVVMGSIASMHPDPQMPEYSESKLELENYVESISTHSKYPILYLRLTSSSYKNYQLVANSVQFWLSNPDITFIGYNINE